MTPRREGKLLRGATGMRTGAGRPTTIARPARPRSPNAPGFRLPPTRRSSSCPRQHIGKEHLFSTEKLGTVLAIFKYHGFDMALDMVRQIFETGGKGHSCGIYSFDDDHIHRLALVAPVSRIMVRQIQSSANAGTFTNGMPMTSSMGCGVWGGNITNENISLKHYMNVTWVSRPIPEDEPSEAELFGEFYNSEIFEPLARTMMTTLAATRRGPSTETRIASYLLVEYLERLGVEVIFGLCGHTNIAFLDALSKSRIRFITGRHEQVAAHAADGYARASGKAWRPADPSRAGPDQRRHRRGQRGARLDSDGGDCRRHPVVLLRPPPAPGIQPAPGRRSVPDLSAVLQARLSRRSRRRPAAHHGARVPSAPDRPARSRCWSTCRWTSSRRTCRSTHSSQVPAEIAPPAIDADDRRTHRRRAGERRAAGDLRRRRRAVGARHAQSSPRSPRRSKFRSRTR